MGAKNVTKIIFVLLMAVPLISTIAQEKYLLFDAKKDSVIELEGIEYFKIDGNLFDIDRYSQIDTIGSGKLKNIEFLSVKELWGKMRETDEKYIKSVKYGDPIQVIDTYNSVFIYIYILEKIDDCNYKRTRVWWIDY